MSQLTARLTTFEIETLLRFLDPSVVDGSKPVPELTTVEKGAITRVTTKVITQYEALTGLNPCTKKPTHSLDVVDIIF